MMNILKLLVLFGIISCKNSIHEYNTQIDNCYYKKVTPKGYEVTILDEKCLVGSRFPILYATTINGDTINESYFKKVTVINLWFENCAPCVAEIPGLNELEKKYTDVNFLALSTDDESSMLDFLNRVEFNFDHMSDGSQIIEKYFAQTGYPTTYLLNDKRIIIDLFSGGRTDSLASSEIFNRISSKLDSIGYK